MHAKYIPFVVAALAATPAFAERALVSTDGTIYAETEAPFGTHLAAGSQSILLSDQCAAEIPGKGEGRWYWTGQGTRVVVGTYSVRFDGVPQIPLYRCLG